MLYNTRSNLILGFHGCDKSVAQSLLGNPKNVKISERPYDWLGHGFYLWENNYKRALQWAKDKKEVKHFLVQELRKKAIFKFVLEI